MKTASGWLWSIFYLFCPFSHLSNPGRGLFGRYYRVVEPG